MSESLHFGHHLLRLMVEDQTERRQIVRELCSAIGDSGKVSTQDVEGVLTRHGVEFDNKKTHHGTDYGGGPAGYERVKCPRSGCPGHGYIRSW